MLNRVVREHLDGLELAHRGEWRPWKLLAPQNAGVEIVAARTTASANSGARFFLAWLHGARNATRAPCTPRRVRLRRLCSTLATLAGGRRRGGDGTRAGSTRARATHFP